MDDYLWQCLITRLKYAAHNKGMNTNPSIIDVKLYFKKGGELVGWSKPFLQPLEPHQFPLDIIPKDNVG